MRSIFKRLCLVLGVALACAGAWAGGGAVRPSDCQPRDADSTCAAAVAGAAGSPITERPDDLLYDGPLGGVPTAGYSYWGWDFVAEQAGVPSPVRQDEYINRSRVPVTLTFSFDVPAGGPCARDCLPGLEFEIGPGWYKVDPPYARVGNVVTLKTTIRPGDGYAWVIALWQATHPRVSVTVPRGSGATLVDVGLGPGLAVATRVPAVTTLCDCGDGSTASCSPGSHFSNGLLGAWNQNDDGYSSAGAFSSCAINH